VEGGRGNVPRPPSTILSFPFNAAAPSASTLQGGANGISIYSRAFKEDNNSTVELFCGIVLYEKYEEALS
jgi:hypothetical protein